MTYQVEIDWDSAETLFSFHFCEFKYNLNNLELEYWSEFFSEHAYNLAFYHHSFLDTYIVRSWNHVALLVVSGTWTSVLNPGLFQSSQESDSKVWLGDLFKSLFFKLLQLNARKKEREKKTNQTKKNTPLLDYSHALFFLKVWSIASYNSRDSICDRDCIFPKLKYLLPDPLQKKCVHPLLN